LNNVYPRIQNTLLTLIHKAQVMKKIIILAIATLSTGIVLSSSLKKQPVVVKPIVIEKNIAAEKSVNAPSYDALGTAD
jgi:hypothetical protein